MVSMTELVINYMEREGISEDKSLESLRLNGKFFYRGGFIYKKVNHVRRVSTWEIKILFEEFILN